jgi:hypothetical protein
MATAKDIEQILAAAAAGMSAQAIADMVNDEDNEGWLDSLDAEDNDDSDAAAERRACRAGLGPYDFNQYARNDAGEYVNYM